MGSQWKCTPHTECGIQAGRQAAAGPGGKLMAFAESPAALAVPVFLPPAPPQGACVIDHMVKVTTCRFRPSELFLKSS